ncbi:Bifunctional NAD(P)H-hydrate repair enzyme Nnr [Burkholderiales bacterium]|nr:Bifunctional NAD(P)H-hydrate repair enzyme Nnr [Burkholderiales bacterium]
MDDSRLAPVLTTDALRAIEARHARDGLMERAGTAATAIAQAMLAESRGGSVVVLAGRGNNGGDGFVVARELRRAFHDVDVVFRGDPAALPADARAAHASFAAAGGATIREPRGRGASLVVDALFGIGLARAIGGDYAALVEWANRSGAPVLALDLPSGLDADSGTLREPAIRATATATFIALKPGLLTGDGPDAAGIVSVHALGLDGDLARAKGRRLDWPLLDAMRPERLSRARRNVHKGTFGTLAIVGGAAGMTGAPILAGRAAVRSGAGKVRIGFIATPHPGVDWNAPELMLGDAMHAIDGADAIVAGPGMGRSDASANALRRVIDAPVPLALDADALNLIAASASLREALAARNAATLATPHPAEAARLLETSTADVQGDRLGAAVSLSRRLRAHVVLKGAGSVLAHPDGRFDVNASGNPALATAGSGDVLAGMLGAMLAQGLDPASALRYAVCLHGAAADRLVARGAGPIGAGASELAGAARELLNFQSAR